MKNPFLLLTIGVCSVLLLPTLFMDGMFVDGVFYAAISKNYAHGLGTFWNPYYTSTLFPSCHEQPPLLFFLQGLFFKILGDGFYTERIYCLLAALLNSFLIYRCWKIVRPSGGIAWLPILFWFTMPVTFYAFINNLEECTMSIFVLAAMIHLLRALHTKQKETLHFILAGGMILLAGLTKGFQGMFLLAAPFIWWICFRDTSFLRMTSNCFLLLVIPLLFAIYAWYTPVIHESFSEYFAARFVITFNHLRDTTGSRFHILFELLIDSIALMIMLFVILISTKKNFNFSAGWNAHKKFILFFALISLTGILPLMITMEQRGFYLVTALPFLAIACALFVSPQIELIQEKLFQHRKLSGFVRIFGILALSGAIISTVWFYGQAKRDGEKLHDLALIATQIGENKTVLTSKPTSGDWALRAYAMRNHGISITENNYVEDKWLILDQTDSVPTGYQCIVHRVVRYNLYKKQP